MKMHLRMNPLSLGIVLLTIFGLLAVFIYSRPPRITRRAIVWKQGTLGLIVPVYWYGSITSLIKISEAGVPTIAVINLASATGPIVYWNRTTHALQEAGVKTVGDVWTGYNSVPITTVERQIRDYMRWYPDISGIFLDGSSASPSTSSYKYYEALYRYTKSLRKNALVIENPGTWVPQQYLERNGRNTSNIILISENGAPYSMREMKFNTIPAWAHKYPRRRFAVIVHGAKRSQLLVFLKKLTVFEHAGWVYVTNEDEPNPYASLPSYWKMEIQFVEHVDSTNVRTPRNGPPYTREAFHK